MGYTLSPGKTNNMSRGIVAKEKEHFRSSGGWPGRVFRKRPYSPIGGIKSVAGSPTLTNAHRGVPIYVRGICPAARSLFVSGDV